MDTRALDHDERVSVARLHALLELLPRVLDQRMSDVGLTAFEYTLLEALDEAEDGLLRLSALAARTNATLPRLSRVVTGMEKKGLLVRAACTEDGRATNAVLTPAGADRYREARPVFEGAVRDYVLADLDAADVNDLARLSLVILGRLDPDGRLAATAAGETACAADPRPADSPVACAADPARRADSAA